MIVAVNCLTIAWPLVRKVASGKAESYYEAFTLIFSTVKNYVCRHKPDKESERRSQRKKWENSSFRGQAGWREGQSRSWHRTSEATARILKRHKTWRKLNTSQKSQTSATQAEGAIDKFGLEESSESANSRTEAEFYVMPSHEGSARLEPLLADAGMPPIVNASVVNASPLLDTATQPDFTLSAHRQDPVKTQNVGASTREWEIGHQDNPWIRAARELEWNVDVEGGSQRGIC